MGDSEYQSMSDVIRAYVNGRRDNKEVTLLKDKSGINKKIEEAIKKADRDNNQLKEIVKRKKTKEQTALEFQREKNTALFALANDIGLNVESIKTEYENNVITINAAHKIDKWLSDNCKNAAGVSFATHVIKLTHSRIKGASNLFDNLKCRKDQYLTTSSIQNLQSDSALDNAAYASVATLLKLEHRDKNGDSKTLSQYVIEGDKSPFMPLVGNSEVIDGWLGELQKAFGAGRKSSHFLAKQTYYPLVDGNGYHMLLPITSSSMAQELHQKFASFFNDESKKARDQKKANLFSSDRVVYYPDKAGIKVTVSNHTNASELNGKRGGKLSLLSCMPPPQWQQKLKPPTKKASLFHSELGYQSHEPIKRLQKLLMAIKINERSKNDPKIHQRITELVNEIIDMLFNYVQSIHALKAEAGWSVDSTLKEAHQLWLDPYREDEGFQKKRNQKEWQREIEDDFSMWLNKQLEHKKMNTGTQLQRLWKDIFAPRFRKFHAITEAEL